MKPKPTKAQGFRLAPRQTAPVCLESWWTRYATGPREDGQLEAEAVTRALKSASPVLLADWTSTV